jgi:hypothetical protein
MSLIVCVVIAWDDWPLINQWQKKHAEQTAKAAQNGQPME